MGACSWACRDRPPYLRRQTCGCAPDRKRCKAAPEQGQNRGARRRICPRRPRPRWTCCRGHRSSARCPRRPLRRPRRCRPEYPALHLCRIAARRCCMPGRSPRPGRPWSVGLLLCPPLRAGCLRPGRGGDSPDRSSCRSSAPSERLPSLRRAGHRLERSGHSASACPSSKSAYTSSGPGGSSPCRCAPCSDRPSAQ